MPKYTAHFNVDGAVSHGFGLKEPSVYDEDVELTAEDDSRAYKTAIYKAAKIAVDGLSNPDTGNTKVTISGIESELGTINLDGKTVRVSCDEFSHLRMIMDPKLVTKFKKGIKERLASVA